MTGRRAPKEPPVRYCYFDLINNEVVEYRPDRATHDPSTAHLLIAETIIADGITVQTVFDGKAIIGRQGEPCVYHPHGWMECPPLHFWTLVENDYEVDFLEGYKTLADAQAGHAAHVRSIQRDLGLPIECA